MEVQDKSYGAGKVVHYRKKSREEKLATVALVRFKLKSNNRIHATEYVVVEHDAPSHAHIVPW